MTSAWNCERQPPRFAKVTSAVSVAVLAALATVAQWCMWYAPNYNFPAFADLV